MWNGFNLMALFLWYFMSISVKVYIRQVSSTSSCSAQLRSCVCLCKKKRERESVFFVYSACKFRVNTFWFPVTRSKHAISDMSPMYSKFSHYMLCAFVNTWPYFLLLEKLNFFLSFRFIITFGNHVLFFLFLRSDILKLKTKKEQGMKTWYDYIPYGGKFNWSCVLSFSLSLAFSFSLCRKWSYFAVDFSNFLIGFGTVAN